MAHGSQEAGDDDQHAGYGWLMFCVVGMVSSLTLYGIALEYATSGGRQLHEWSFVFVTTSIYAITAFIARTFFGEKPTEISKYNMLILSVTSIASTFTSVRSLRYVIYPVQVLFKSCKPVPVMAFNVMFGKKYKLTKYVNVVIITAGVGLFMGGGNSTQNKGGMDSDTTLMGALMLSLSLCFDGATGAYEDKLMSKNNVEPFDLMYNIQLGKAVISFCVLVATNGLNDFLHTIDTDGFSLTMLGATGAMGQVFVFITISKFGALNCALIGLGRKMLSLLLSFLLYGHTMNAFQTVGLALSLIAMIANFYEKGGKKEAPPAELEGVDEDGLQKPTALERTGLLAPDGDDEEGIEEGISMVQIPYTDSVDGAADYTVGEREPPYSDARGVDLLDLEEDPASTYSDLPESRADDLRL
ncbi:UAA transporter family-domain-containing protein [Ochromonadaceae sp. CCMP2298]|nr:UAA transporter family-domain-containing protein [Ochromonadaceae sp. CCMP2298]|mmetsp:Transcript_12156/g.27119  ORF Transcript_12156/g.27119 Transcript_12156/m.27119 type:complete len:414 (-) Transcript_12156:71-1312(-)